MDKNFTLCLVGRGKLTNSYGRKGYLGDVHFWHVNFIKKKIKNYFYFFFTPLRNKARHKLIFRWTLVFCKTKGNIQKTCSKHDSAVKRAGSNGYLTIYGFKAKINKSSLNTKCPPWCICKWLLDTYTSPNQAPYEVSWSMAHAFLSYCLANVLCIQVSVTLTLDLQT